MQWEKKDRDDEKKSHIVRIWKQVEISSPSNEVSMMLNDEYKKGGLEQRKPCSIFISWLFMIFNFNFSKLWIPMFL